MHGKYSQYGRIQTVQVAVKFKQTILTKQTNYANYTNYTKLYMSLVLWQPKQN